MSYPSFEQYNNALQAHQRLLTDPELQRGSVAMTGLGIPLAISGGFALTYTISSGTKKYAVRCFHRESKALERRYQAIAKRLAALKSQYFLDFEFQTKGINVDGGSYPIVKMAWAQGVTLGEYLEDNRSRKGALSGLPDSLLALSLFLERENLAHGDLSTGNIMVAGKSGAVQLIDYDGMFVEDIKDLGSSELGNINFQHPDRAAKNPFGPTMDRFSLIALSLALKALDEDPALWDKTNSDMDAVVFRANDFIDPASSPVFSELMHRSTLATHAQNFAAICKAPFEKAPSLEDFLAGRNIPATAIKISSTPEAFKARAGYMGVYDVLNGGDYQLCLRRVGDKVEVIGRIAEVKQNKARNGKPYIFINFGPWQGMIFKVAIWSEGLDAISKKPDMSWVGKWLSVVGLMEPPYESKKYRYSHLSINVTANGQMAVITAEEAKFRMAVKAANISAGSSANKETLAKLKGETAQSSVQSSRAPSSNKDILNSIRQAKTGSQSRQTQSVRPQSPPQAYSLQQKTPEKGIIGKLIDWLIS